jgi:hypothetical protein
MKIFISCVVLSFFGITVVSAQVNIFGTWIAYKFKGGQFSEMDDKEAAKRIGSTVILENSFAKIFEDSCQNITYQIRKAKASEYLYYNYHTYPKTLGIANDEFQVLELYCGKIRKNGQIKKMPDFNLLIIDENTIIASGRGYFFWLKKK